MSQKLAKLPVPALIAAVAVLAVIVGLSLPGPSHGKPEPRSSLQMLTLKPA